MKIALFVSSAGDTDLALSTAEVLRKQGHQTIFIPLTIAADVKVDKAAKLATIPKKTIHDILALNPEVVELQRFTDEQLTKVMCFLYEQQITHTFVGVPSERSNEMAFQIAEQIRHMPVLLVSEFMFKIPAAHTIWQHMAKLKENDKLHWSVPLKKTQDDFELDTVYTHITGHLSIDRALAPLSHNVTAIRHDLGIDTAERLLVMSSTTQPVDCDTTFLKTMLDELPNHPNVKMRLSLHPNIRDLDAYVSEIIKVYLEYGSPNRFQIIMPPSWREKLKQPNFHIDNPTLTSLFLFKEITGPQAAAAGDMIVQAVAGALLNEAVMLGKAVHTTLANDEAPCLPNERFAESPPRLFSVGRQSCMTKTDLGLEEGVSAGQACAIAVLRGT